MNPLSQQEKNQIKSFTPVQREEYNRYRASGFDAQAALRITVAEGESTTASRPSPIGQAIRQAPQDLMSGFRSIANDIQQYGGEAAINQAPARLLGGVGRSIGTVAGGILGQADESITGGSISNALGGAIESAVNTPVGQDLVRGATAVNDATRGIAGDVLDAFNIAGVGALASAPANQLRRNIISSVRQTSAQAVEGAGRGTRSLREIVGGKNQTPQTSISPARVIAEETAPNLTVGERSIGLTPDVKRRIAGKSEKMQEYIDVAKTRNVDDTAPTPYEYGASRANQAVQQMETLLNESGGRIGATRQKLGTYQATIDQITGIENTFNNQIGKLNLEVRNGQIQQKAGTITKASTGDINVLNEMYQNLQTVKQSPNLTNLIEFRSSVDSRINFGKRANEVSNEVDPLARQIRREVADVGAKIVGKTEAAELKRFSEFMDAYNDLRGYTDRAAGGEYLLRLVLSGRGGEARQVINTIKEYTGIDLLDDATMMTLVTDMLGNPAQKNLFRQEITNAGLDAANILSGNPVGILQTAVRRGSEVLFEPEKVLREASQ